MSASASRGILAMAIRHLMSRWEETSQSWRDSKASDFEATYLADLQATISAAIRTIEELDQMLEKVHANCE